jgi:serpin B
MIMITKTLNKRNIGIFIICCFLAAGISVQKTLAIDSNPEEPNINAVVLANNKFAFDLYARLAKKHENVFCSPYGLSVAMAMVYEGAGGRTADEIRQVFYFPEDETIRRNGFKDLIAAVNTKNSGSKFVTANALWAEKTYLFSSPYLKSVERYYAGKATNLDFIKAPAQSRNTINDWVAANTAQKITNLLSQYSIDEMTLLVVTNAVYFKGEWRHHFKERDTKKRKFRVGSGNTVKVPMMCLTEPKIGFEYAETATMQILELPYAVHEFSMFILLPKDDKTEQLDASLTLEQFLYLKDSMRIEEVDIYIPKFLLTTEYSMAGILEDMGMKSAFSLPLADFSGMTGTKDLYLDAVFHQAFVEVNEQGTEAAAATDVIGVRPCIGQAENFRKLFLADHPFVFIIVHKATGIITFIGRVLNPKI